MDNFSKIPHSAEGGEGSPSNLLTSGDSSGAFHQFSEDDAPRETLQPQPAVVLREEVKEKCLNGGNNVLDVPDKIGSNALANFVDFTTVSEAFDETPSEENSSTGQYQCQSPSMTLIPTDGSDPNKIRELLDLSTAGEGAGTRKIVDVEEVIPPRVEEVKGNADCSSKLAGGNSLSQVYSKFSTDNVFISTDASIQDVLTMLSETPLVSEFSKPDGQHTARLNHNGNTPSADIFLSKETLSQVSEEPSGAYKYLSAIDSFSPGVVSKRVVKKWKYSDARKMDGLTPSGAMTSVGCRARRHREKVIQSRRKHNDEGQRPSKVKISDVKQIWFFAPHSEASVEKAKSSPNTVANCGQATEESGVVERRSVTFASAKQPPARSIRKSDNDGPCEAFQPGTLRISSKPIGLPLSWLCDEKDGEIACTPDLEDIGKRTSTIVLSTGHSRVRSASSLMKPYGESSACWRQDVTDDSSEAFVPPSRLPGIKSPRSPCSASNDSDVSTILFPCEMHPIRKARVLSEEFSPITPPGETGVLDKLSCFRINSEYSSAEMDILSISRGECLDCDYEESDDEGNDGSIRPLSSGKKIPNEIPSFILDKWKDSTAIKAPRLSHVSTRADQREILALSCSQSMSSTVSGPTSASLHHGHAHLTISTSSSSKSAEQKLRSLSFPDTLTEIH